MGILLWATDLHRSSIRYINIKKVGSGDDLGTFRHDEQYPATHILLPMQSLVALRSMSSPSEPMINTPVIFLNLLRNGS
jgi:hypothetical protein